MKNASSRILVSDAEGLSSNVHKQHAIFLWKCGIPLKRQHSWEKGALCFEKERLKVKDVEICWKALAVSCTACTISIYFPHHVVILWKMRTAPFTTMYKL